MWSIVRSLTAPRQPEYVQLSTLDADDRDKELGIVVPPSRSRFSQDSPTHYSPTRALSRINSARLRTLLGLCGLASAFVLLVIVGLWQHAPVPLPPPRKVHLNVSDNPYFTKEDTWQHNLGVFARLERCAELGMLVNTSSPLNPRRSHAEEAAAAAEGCGWNETTVVVLASLYIQEAVGGGQHTGETVYGQSVVSSLNANGYAYIFSGMGWINWDSSRTAEFYRKYRDNIRLVIADPEQIDDCWGKNKEEATTCLKTERNLDGIPAWKMLALWWWDTPGTPLGREFTLSPTPTNDNYFLSYSIEPSCARIPSIPHGQRTAPPQVYVLAKQIHYLAEQDRSTTGNFSWSLTGFKKIAASLHVRFAGGMDTGHSHDLPEYVAAVEKAGVHNYGKLGAVEFYEQLANSAVFLGVGRPRISPSPFDALCLGVPFINPILTWNTSAPQDRTQWHPQQWHMVDLPEPYVYHVHAHDLAGLQGAISRALNNPIEGYIPPYMKFEWVARRMAETVERDWESVGRGVLERLSEDGGEGETFVM